jgi:hypothetical protein
MKIGEKKPWNSRYIRTEIWQKCMVNWVHSSGNNCQDRRCENGLGKKRKLKVSLGGMNDCEKVGMFFRLLIDFPGIVLGKKRKYFQVFKQSYNQKCLFIL